MKKIIRYTALGLILIVATLAINLLIFSKIAQQISSGPPIPTDQLSTPALMVIDIQNGTTGEISATSAYIRQSEALISGINEIVSEAVKAQIPVIYIRSEVSNFMVNLLNNTMAKGSEGAELDDRMDVVSDLIVTKTKNDAFSNPDLDRVLREMGINEIYLTGLDAAGCVHSTLLAAQNRGYHIAVIEDLVISDKEEIKAEMMVEFKALGVDILQSDDFIEKF